jgi:succinate-acetate transporter protein
LATLKVNLLLIILFFLLDLTFLFLMMSEFSGNLTVHKIGGGACLATSAVAFYGGAASLFTKENAWFTLPVGTIRRDSN